MKDCKTDSSARVDIALNTNNRLNKTVAYNTKLFVPLWIAGLSPNIGFPYVELIPIHVDVGIN